MNRKIQARSSQLVAALQALRREGEVRRAALYWTLQSMVRNRKRTAAIRALLARRSLLRVYSDDIAVEELNYLQPVVVGRGYCPPPACVASDLKQASALTPSDPLPAA